MPADPSSASTRRLRFGVVILAAGASSRMGEPKQLLEIDGRSLLVRTLEAALASDAWPVVVVLGAHAERIRPALARFPVLAVENPAWAEGMASSLRAGIATLEQFSRRIEAALVTLCDQPRLSAGVLQRLVRTQERTGSSIVAARYAQRNAAPALFLRQHFPTLAGLTGEEGARALLNGTGAGLIAVDLPELATDLDTPADVAAYKDASS